MKRNISQGRTAKTLHYTLLIVNICLTIYVFYQLTLRNCWTENDNVQVLVDLVLSIFQSKLLTDGSFFQFSFQGFPFNFLPSFKCLPLMVVSTPLHKAPAIQRPFTDRDMWFLGQFHVLYVTASLV